MKKQIKCFLLHAFIMSVAFVCACSEKGDLPVPLETSVPAVSSAPTVASSPEESIGAAPSASVLSLDDIMSIIKVGNNRTDIQVINVTNIGADWQLVEFDLQAYNEFLLYNSKTGAYEKLCRNAKLLNAVSENHLIFEITGDWNEGGFLHFPYIEEYIRRANDGDAGFYLNRQPEFYELERSVKGGSHEGCKLSAVNASFDGFEALFKPADGSEGMGFWAAASYIPPSVTSYDNSTHQLTIEIDNCQLDGSIRTDTDIKTGDNGYMSSYKVTQKDGVIYITATLRPTAAGYSIRTGKVPAEGQADGYPYFAVQFTDLDAMSANQYRYNGFEG